MGYDHNGDTLRSLAGYERQPFPFSQWLVESISSAKNLADVQLRTNRSILNMPITIKETIEYRKQLGIKDIPSMTNDEYRETFTEKTWLFYVDHNDFIRSYFTGEILAANKEQIDVMIELLTDLKNHLED